MVSIKQIAKKHIIGPNHFFVNFYFVVKVIHTAKINIYIGTYQ